MKFLIAPAICLILFWRVPFMWFLNDDFAWLGLPLEVNNIRDLVHTLFAPMAQGTVRFLSERAYFLIFGSLFEMNAFSVNALAFHLCALLTWFGSLSLAAVIGARLTGSRFAGFAAAALWTCHGAIVLPLMWASSYNQILCSFLVLAALYARLRWIEEDRGRWLAIEWLAYLACFGANEIVVMYPFIALLHGLCFSAKRKHWIDIAALMVPAGVFTAIHFWVIPKSTGPYVMAVDHRLPLTFFKYLEWALSPTLIADPGGLERTLALLAALFVGVGLLAFCLRKSLLPIFCLGWFVLWLGPVMPLPEHLTEYYVTIPVLGLAWLGGWAVERAWTSHRVVWRVACGLLAAVYLTSSIYQIQAASVWVYSNSNRMKMMLKGADAIADKYPGSPLLLAGVDERIILAGFFDDPFRLYGIRSVYLTPGTEKTLSTMHETAAIGKYVTTTEKAADLIRRDKARVMMVSRNQITDVTRSYSAILAADAQPTRRNFVNVGQAGYEAQLGPTWHRLENATRWMPKSATVQLDDVEASAHTLYITGYASPETVANGEVTVSLRGNGREIGKVRIAKPGGPFSFSLPLPKELVGQSSVKIEIELNKVLHLPGEDRELGLIFGTFAIR